MIKVLIMTHGEAGVKLKDSAEMIVGDLPYVEALALKPGMSMEELMDRANSFIKSDDRKTLVLTDIYGGTPSNTALALSLKHGNKCICGVNLAMLLEIACSSDKVMEELTEEYLKQICAAGKEACQIMNIER